MPPDDIETLHFYLEKPENSDKSENLAHTHHSTLGPEKYSGTCACSLLWFADGWCFVDVVLK